MVAKRTSFTLGHSAGPAHTSLDISYMMVVETLYRRVHGQRLAQCLALQMAIMARDITGKRYMIHT
jgi:hypothetical protein